MMRERERERECVCVCVLPLTSLAEVESGLLLDSLRDVHRRPQTRHARVRGVWFYGSTALTAQSGEREIASCSRWSRELTFSGGQTVGRLLAGTPFLPP